MALLLLLSLLTHIRTTHSDSWYGSKFECFGRNKCYDDQIHCEDNKHCIIGCKGANACQYSVIHCPHNAKCEVQCLGGIDACKDVVFLAAKSASLSIACDRTQEEACDETVIYCPNNGRSGPITCKISGVSLTNVKSKMEIFAMEGLNDVEITGTYINNALLYCGRQYSHACSLSDTSPFKQCISNDKTCEHYILPTAYPTTSPSVRPMSPHPTPNPTTEFPTTDPTDFPTDQPTPIPSDQPTPNPIYQATPTRSPTRKPIHRESVETTKRPTSKPTKRDHMHDVDSPTESPRVRTTQWYMPTRNPNKPTPPSRNLNLLNTTNAAAFDAMDDEAEIDPNSVAFTDMEHAQKTNYSPLYYVIGALLVSVCYISGSLFCWVHYNHKYTSRVIALKRHSHLQPPGIHANAMNAPGPGVVWQANHLHEPGAAALPALPAHLHNKSNINNINNDLLFVKNRNRHASSVASNVTAPTTISGHYKCENTNGNIIEEEADSVPTTSSKPSPHSQTSMPSIHSIYSIQSQSYYTRGHGSEHKEVDYETNVGYACEHTGTQQVNVINDTNVNNSNEQIYIIGHGDQHQRLTMDTIEFENTYIHDDASVVQYGENIRDGPRETHSLNMSNLSEYNMGNAQELLVTRYNSVLPQQFQLQSTHNVRHSKHNTMATAIHENEEFKEVNYETNFNHQYQERELQEEEEVEDTDEEPVQPLMNTRDTYNRYNIVFQTSDSSNYNNVANMNGNVHSLMSPQIQINKSISISGSPSTLQTPPP